MLSYGLDVPAVECVVIARPTRSIVLYKQAVGRGMRPSPGKDHLIIIDHGRVVESLGMPHEEFAWSLDDDKNVNKSTRAKVAQRKHTDESPRSCPECTHMWLVSEDGPACDLCGWLPAPAAKRVAVQDADLQEIGGNSYGANREAESLFYREALSFYSKRWPDRWAQRPNSGYWWSWIQTRERFQIKTERPPSDYWRATPAPISAATQGWIKSKLIAYARRTS